MKRNKVAGKIIYILILVLLFVLLTNPQLLPFLGDETQAQISAAVEKTFGAFSVDDGTSAFSLPKIFNMVAVIILVLLVSNLVRFIIERSTIHGKRSQTVAILVLSIIKYAGVIVIVMWCLSIMGVNITGIFASVGVLSLIIGFGAQSLIEDIITGIFIIFEGQYNVGDIIILGDFRGTVQRIGVRTTSIVDAGGNVKIVNNSDIRDVQNRSENPSVAVCDVGISYEERIEHAEQILEKGLPVIADKYPELFLDVPSYLGVQEVGASSVVMRVIAYVREENVFTAQRKLNREIKILFDDNNIEIPFTQIVLHNAYNESKEEKQA